MIVPAFVVIVVGLRPAKTGDDWDDFIDHDVKTLVERGDVEKAYIRASGPLVR